MYITPDFRIVQDTSGDPQKKNRFISFVHKKDTKTDSTRTKKDVITSAIDQYKAIIYKKDKESGKMAPTPENFDIYKGRSDGKPPVMVLATLSDSTILVLDEKGKMHKVNAD